MSWFTNAGIIINHLIHTGTEVQKRSPTFFQICYISSILDFILWKKIWNKHCQNIFSFREHFIGQNFCDKIFQNLDFFDFCVPVCKDRLFQLEPVQCRVTKIKKKSYNISIKCYRFVGIFRTWTLLLFNVRIAECNFKRYIYFQ